MSIAITEDHRRPRPDRADFLDQAAAPGRRPAALLEAEDGAAALLGRPGGLGWLGLHVPEAQGGSGFGLPELVVVVEQLGRAVAPGPFVPTVIASAVLAAAGGASPTAAARARGRLR